MLARLDPPVEAAQDDLVLAGDAKTLDGEDRSGDGRHPASMVRFARGFQAAKARDPRLRPDDRSA